MAVRTNVIGSILGKDIQLSELVIAGQTKGDSIVFNGTNWVRFPVGANNLVITADSGETKGVKYAEPPAIKNVWKDTSTADESTASTSFVDTTLSITQTTGANRVLLLFNGEGSNSAARKYFRIIVDATVIATAEAESGTDAFCLTGISEVLSAASHTFKIQFKAQADTSHLLGDRTVSEFTVVEI